MKPKARRGGGPRSAAGRARTRMNALRHGLAGAVPRDAAAGELAQRLSGFYGDGAAAHSVLVTAREIEICQRELCRIRIVRQRLTQDLAYFEPGVALETVLARVDDLMKLERYERRALSRRKFLLRALWDTAPSPSSAGDHRE